MRFSILFGHEVATGPAGRLEIIPVGGERLARKHPVPHLAHQSEGCRLLLAPGLLAGPYLLEHGQFERDNALNEGLLVVVHHVPPSRLVFIAYPAVLIV